MHLLQIYKLFPFREDLEEYMNDSIWVDWPQNDSLKPDPADPLYGTILAEADVDPQQWLLALHLTVSWPDRSNAAFIARELEIEPTRAQTVLEKVNRGLKEHPEFYARLAKSLGSCSRCG